MSFQVGCPFIRVYLDKHFCLSSRDALKAIIKADVDVKAFEESGVEVYLLLPRYSNEMEVVVMNRIRPLI
jgi:hypothetical protein